MRREGDYYENEFCKKATALAMSVLFAVSMAGCGSSASTAKKVEVTSVEDLADLKIGVQTGTTGDSLRRAMPLMQIPRCSVTTKAPMLFRH